MDWVIVPRVYLFKKVVGEVGMVVFSVDIVILSLDPDILFV